jgi:hypothetical protein
MTGTRRTLLVFVRDPCSSLLLFTDPLTCAHSDLTLKDQIWKLDDLGLNDGKNDESDKPNHE